MAERGSRRFEDSESRFADSDELPRSGGVKRRLGGGGGGGASGGSCAVLLRNMVAPGEAVDEEALAGETRDECTRYGVVRGCVVRQAPARVRCRDEDRVLVFVCFERHESALRAFKDMDQRFFSGRQISVTFFDEERFHQGDFDEW